MAEQIQLSEGEVAQWLEPCGSAINKQIPAYVSSVFGKKPPSYLSGNDRINWDVENRYPVVEAVPLGFESASVYPNSGYLELRMNVLVLGKNTGWAPRLEMTTSVSCEFSDTVRAMSKEDILPPSQLRLSDGFFPNYLVCNPNTAICTGFYR